MTFKKPCPVHGFLEKTVSRARFRSRRSEREPLIIRAAMRDPRLLTGWMPEHPWLVALPEFPGDAPITICLAANLREWCALIAAQPSRLGRHDPVDDRRHALLESYPFLVGRN